MEDAGGGLVAVQAGELGRVADRDEARHAEADGVGGDDVPGAAAVLEGHDGVGGVEAAELAGAVEVGGVAEVAAVAEALLADLKRLDGDDGARAVGEAAGGQAA